MNSIRIQSKVIGSVKNPNCKFTSLQVLQLLVLFPFFSVKNAANYSSSALSKLFACHKDMFYRFMNDGNVNWRRIIYSVFRQLYSRVSRKTTSKSDVKCVIIDDTDLPKTGFKTEKIGIVFSHTQMKPILGFKAMLLCFTDGVSQSILDFSLHGEEGIGIKVNLFFNRKGKNGNWNALLTSDMKLDVKEAFRLYSRRWVIEVAHKEMKQNLKLGKNQCRGFAGQIAGISLCVLQYNILSYVKRNESYETIGGLFAEITKNSVELSVAEKIWLLIVEVINVIAEAFNCDAMALTEQIISNDKQIKAVKEAFDKLAVAA